MTTSPSPYSFENLVHNGILKIQSKDDKNVLFDLGVFGGTTSITVFTGPGGKPWKLPLPRKVIDAFIVLLTKMRDNPTTKREAVFLNRFEETDGRKGFKQYGCLGFGIDESLNFYIDISANELPGRYMFPVKRDPRFDMSHTAMTDRDYLIADINSIIHAFENTAYAERMTTYKRQNNGNNGGGNNNWNKGGNNNWKNNNGGGSNYNRNGGGNNNYQQGGTFGGGNHGGSVEIESDLHV
jgi:hypothetical protein